MAALHVQEQRRPLGLLYGVGSVGEGEGGDYHVQNISYLAFSARRSVDYAAALETTTLMPVDPELLNEQYTGGAFEVRGMEVKPGSAA